MLVDCLRRYELEREKEEKDRAQAEKENAPPPADAVEAGEKSGGETGTPPDVPPEAPPDPSGLRGLLAAVRSKFGLKSLPLICTKRVRVGDESVDAALEKCQGFCSSLLEEDPTGASLLERKLLPKLSTLLSEKLDAEKPASLVCGMLSFTGNTQQSNAQRARGGKEGSTEPENRLSLPVLLAGTSGSVPPLPGKDKGLVLYAGTSDDDLSLVLWSYSKESAAKNTTLAAHCAEVLKNVEPLAEDDALAMPSEVSLPIFDIRARTALSHGGPAGTGKGAAPAVQLLEASFGPGRPQPGLLQPEDGSPDPRRSEPLKLDGPFVFCVCHSALEALDRPLFAVVVYPADCRGGA